MEKTKHSTKYVTKYGRSYFLFVLVFAGCSSRPCREPRAPELDRTVAPPASASLVVDPISTPAVTAAKETPAAGAVADLVRVYKPDGSRQCEKKPGMSLEIMERELAGITVHGRNKRKDGLMHVQVCGSPSGMINVFEIKASFLKQAEQRGFKRLED